ncbi:MAG: ATP-grasp domain-containing protein [Promethearchaeota archaeon]
MNVKLIVLGFNSRPLAEACRDLDIEVVVLDYFGDEDIHGFIHAGYFFIDRMEQIGKEPDPADFKQWIIETLPRAIEVSFENGELGDNLPMILVGSGFDDDPDFIRQVEKFGMLASNNPAVIEACRDIGLIKELVKKKEILIHFPNTMILEISRDVDVREVRETITSTINFPLVLKRAGSGGGVGITLVKNGRTLNSAMIVLREELESTSMSSISIIAQEYIHRAGTYDMSVLALDGEIVSINKQIIGEAQVHAPGPFFYCGNEVPARNVPGELLVEIKELVQALHSRVGVRGLFGIDFLLSGTRIYFIEVNPRVPGSMEPVNLSLGMNLMKCHLDSFMNFSTPGNDCFTYDFSALEEVPARHVFKYVLFAPDSFTMPRMGGLDLVGEVRDITPPGRKVKKGKPVLSYLFQGMINTPERNKMVAMMEIQKIYEHIIGGTGGKNE